MKYSRYNVLVDYRDGKTLLYNTLTEALVLLDERGLIHYNSCLGETDNANEWMQDLLVDNGFLIDDDVDELAVVYCMNRKRCCEDKTMSSERRKAPTSQVPTSLPAPAIT